MQGLVMANALSSVELITDEKPTNEMVRRLILLREGEDRRSSF